MANRQYGKSRSPAGGRIQTDRRPGRAVPVSRSPASVRSGEVWTASPPYSGIPGYRGEPEIRRWPHPVEDQALPAAAGPEPALHYIRCALSYQNQLLADIKVLLEQLAEDRPARAGTEDVPEKE